jgi:hypothetical protein
VLLGAGGSTVIFTVENLGTSNLNLTGTPRVAISGVDAAMFAVGTQPGSPVAAGGTTVFTITFNPTTAGAKTASVSIANNDSNENPYTFNLTGAGASPEIDVTQAGTSIPSGIGSYDFGQVTIIFGSATATFTVENLGTADLNLTGVPRVVISGKEAALFTVVVQPDSPVAAPGSTAFLITFRPLTRGDKKATVTIANDDQDESPYTFILTGEGIRY